MAILKVKLGTKVLEIISKGDSEADMIKSFSFWSQLPDKCGACGSDNIALNYKSPKGNDYYGLKCLKCNAELTFHQLKEGKGWYLTADDKFAVYKGKE